MALFNRSEKTTIPELQEYYDNQRKNRTGTAWLMALASLLVTVAVLSGLFFGGRWLYRTIANRNKNDSSETKKDVATVSNGSSSSQSGSSSSSNGNTNSGSTQTGTTSPTSGGRVTDQAASTTVPNTGSVAGTTTTSENLPNTGPADLTVIIVAIMVGAIATASASVYQAKR